MEAGGRTTPARRYHLCPAPLDAQAFARAVRAHWGVENRLHRVLDVVFHDGLGRLRTGPGPENIAMSLLNNTAKLKDPKHAENAPAGTTTTCKPSSPKPHEPLQAIALQAQAPDALRPPRRLT